MAWRYFADEGRTRPEHDQRCLACHVTPGTPQSVAITKASAARAATAHSTEWRHKHYLPEWKAARSAPGFHDLRKPSERARSCVGCHVGGAGQDVNHDLIAAGHPPLRFELGAFHEQLPKHWDFEREKADDPHIEARLWLAGQIESSRAALDLLNQRLTSSHGIWPEFAEYDCESCHHPITASRPRPGVPLWGSWHFSPRIVDASLAAGWNGEVLQRQLATLRSNLANLSVSPGEILPVVEALRSMWPTSEAADRTVSPSYPRWLDAIEELEPAEHQRC